MTIEIAVPTYNCAKWLDALFESILSQDFKDWRILARDDASKDNTAPTLITWKERLGDRLVIINDSAGNLGMVGNYNAVLEATTAPLVMLADPDDVWLPEKISASLSAMKSAELRFGAETPIVVCADAKVVDENLEMIAPSYWDWSRHRPDLLNVFRRMIVENPALTSTMIVNRALLKLALPMTDASCPDWWLALVGCAFGHIIHLSNANILYRRHAANDSEAPISSTVRGAAGRLHEVRGRVDRQIRQYARQAGAFLAHYKDSIPAQEVAALQAAQCLPSMGRLERRWVIARHGLWLGSPIKNVGLMLFL